MPLINCKINLTLTWAANCVISGRNGVTTFAIIDRKFYVLFVTLSTSYNAKLLQELKSRLNRTTGINISQK